MNINRVLNVICIALMFMCFINVKTYAQKKTIIYEMGRPNALDYNIAKRIIGKEYKLAFDYVGQDMIDSLGVDYFENSNVISREKVAKKYGDNWMAEFHDKTNSELSKQHYFRGLIKELKPYKKIKNDELYILFDNRRCCKNRYNAYVIGRYFINNEYRMRSILKVWVNTKNNKISRIKEKEMSLPYNFEENGIY